MRCSPRLLSQVFVSRPVGWLGGRNLSSTSGERGRSFRCPKKHDRNLPYGAHARIIKRNCKSSRNCRYFLKFPLASCRASNSKRYELYKPCEVFFSVQILSYCTNGRFSALDSNISFSENFLLCTIVHKFLYFLLPTLEKKHACCYFCVIKCLKDTNSVIQ